MDVIRGFLENENYQIIVLFLILALGVMLGRLQVKGVSLGASGVLFVAIFFGHFGASLPSVITTIGVVLFVYAVGLQAGPRFFKTFRSQGLRFAMLAIVTLAAGFLTTAAVDQVFDFHPGLSTGLYAGSMTTTPGLAAAMEAVEDQSGQWAAEVSVGYGIAYPFGVAGVVLFVQLFPRLMRMDLKKLAGEERAQARQGAPKGHWYELRNSQVAGITVSEFTDQDIAEATITRIEREDGQEVLANSDVELKEGDKLWIVSTPKQERILETVIGPKVPAAPPLERNQREIVARDVFVTEENIVGKTLESLQVRELYGVVISRLWREEIEFVPQSNTRLAVGDTIRIVGSPADCERFTHLVGNAEKKLQETNFLPLCAGLVLGSLIGLQPITIPGTNFTLKLGMAGGPLFVALIAGHYGRIGKTSIRMPTAAKIFIRELGLMFFLAGAGVKAGASFWEVLKDQGMTLFVAGVIIALVPMIVAWLTARWVFRLPVLSALGAICGGMTSTPALGALSTASDSETPALAYATVYPVALILVTVLAQILGRGLFALG